MQDLADADRGRQMHNYINAAERGLNRDLI